MSSTIAVATDAKAQLFFLSAQHAVTAVIMLAPTTIVMP
jgi:hypothetical protein